MKLNGIEIPTPENDVQIKEIEIAREERMASGKLVKDIVTTKLRFILTYKGLLPSDALTFINAFRAGKPVTFEYEDFEGLHTKLVFVQSIPRKIFNPKPQYIKDVTITLEEV